MKPSPPFPPAEGRAALEFVAVLWWRLALVVWAGWLLVLGCVAVG